MNQPREDLASRRDFIKSAGKIAAVSALAGVSIPYVHAADSSTIQFALVGCGGRGGGAALNALSTTSPENPIKLVAMADVFPNKLNSAHNALTREAKQNKYEMDVPADRQFIGFDGYKHAMDCLKPGDIVVLTTPPAFRWVHFTYAIQKGLNVFMEKPVSVDGPTTRRMLKLAEDARAKNLKVGVGLMCRHCHARKELITRIEDGQIGDIISMRSYRMKGPEGSAFSPPKPEGISELMYQIQRFHSFLWASGGCYSDFYIHNIDESCWIKNAWPIKAQALGGRHYRGKNIDQNLDTYSVEYTFADGSKLHFGGRTMIGCYDEWASYAHGSKGIATISINAHSPARCSIYKGQNTSRSALLWTVPQPEADPYRLEWDDLIDAVRNDKPYNEVKRGAEASMVASMGRMAAHTGQEITWDMILNSEHEFAPQVDQLTLASDAPLKAGPDGKYPVPLPGVSKKQEYDSSMVMPEV